MKTSHRLVAAALLALAGAVAALAADSQEAAATDRKVNINQASAAQLAFLPRVGAKAAERIVEYRKAHGSFGQAEELMEVKGVGEKLFTQLKPYVTLTGPTTLTAKVRSGSARTPRSTRASRSSGSAGGRKAPSDSASNSVPVGKGR